MALVSEPIEQRVQPVPIPESPGAAERSFAPLLWGVWALAAAASLGPLLVEYGLQTWSSEHYRFAPLLVAAAFWLGYRRLRDESRGRCRTWVRLSLWSVAILAASVAVLAASPFAAAVAVLLTAPAAIYEYGGWPVLRRLLPVWALLWLAIRPPFNWDRSLVIGLQKIAAGWASSVLDLAGVRHLADGVAIRLPEGDFFVDEACSGVHSLFAALAFAGVVSVATGRGPFRAFVLLGASVFWVLVGNAVRICAVVVLSTRYGLAVTEGLGHELIGIGVFACVVALVFSTDRLLLFVFPERERGLLALLREWLSPGGPPEPATDEELPRRRGVLMPAAVAFAFVALAVAGVALPSQRPATHQSQLASTRDFKPFPEETLPAEWEGWTRADFRIERREAGDDAGELSRIWTYRKGRLAAAVSVDGPYDGWHDLTWCYEGLGYTVESAQDVSEDGLTPHTELRLTNDLGRHGLVSYAAYTESDRPVTPPKAGRESPIVERIQWAIQERLGSERAISPERVYQVQVFCQSGLGFTDPEVRDVGRLFQEMRRRIAEAGGASLSTESDGSGATKGDA